MDHRLAPGTRFGRYEIVCLLGEGGMGSVYEAMHVDLKKRVAIKTLHPSLAAIPDATLRFRREGEAASRIRHQHVVDVTDVGVEGEVPYLVMEYLEGDTLAFYLKRKAPLSVTETADLALPVVAAVSAGHEAGVIHRDLKPANILLAVDRARRETIPKVLDFGVSKLDDAQGPEQQALTRTGAHLGTICYMSPEQALGAKHVDARSDQYALGLILYECVTGRRAYRTDDDNTFALLRKIGDNQFEPLQTLRPDLPPPFVEVLMRALGHRPADRFVSMSALGAALLPFASERGAMLWDRVFNRRTAANMDAVADGPPVVADRAARLEAGIAPTLPLAAPAPAAALTVGETVALPAGGANARPGDTRLLPPEPGQGPSSQSGSGLAFEAVAPPAASPALRRTISSRRWPALIALAVTAGAALVVARLIAPPPARSPTSAASIPTEVSAASPPPAPAAAAQPTAPPVAPAVAPPVAPAPAPAPAAPPATAPAPPPIAAAPASAPRPAPAHHGHGHKPPPHGEKAASPAASSPRVGANSAKIME